MNKQSLLLILAISATTIGLSGCTNNSQSGAVIGSLVGAGIGKSTSNHKDRRALVGAVVGGIVGGAIGDAQDRKNAAYRNTTTTTASNNGSSNHTHGGSTHSHAATQQTQVATNPSVSHKHGNSTHSHPGGAGQHTHNTGTTTNTVYVERPYYPVSTSIILGTGYKHSRRHNRKRFYRNGRYYYNR